MIDRDLCRRLMQRSQLKVHLGVDISMLDILGFRILYINHCFDLFPLHIEQYLVYLILYVVLDLQLNIVLPVAPHGLHYLIACAP